MLPPLIQSLLDPAIARLGEDEFEEARGNGWISVQEAETALAEAAQLPRRHVGIIAALWRPDDGSVVT